MKKQRKMPKYPSWVDDFARNHKEFNYTKSLWRRGKVHLSEAEFKAALATAYYNGATRAISISKRNFDLAYAQAIEEIL